MSRYFVVMRGLAAAAAMALLGGLAPVQAGQEDLVENALRAAARTFERALPQLDAVTMGVPTQEYHDALVQRRFASSLWATALDVQLVTNESEQGLCAGFAAYVTPAIQQGAVSLVICPRFFSPGADALRETTILHEMVHVVAGTDECQAMAFTARIQKLATGSFQPVSEYWTRNKCNASRYRLPY
ncbi:MAG: hypothetical protein JWP26_301 [Devosia sp.]|uniref:hypothetical protein n=1 Tax=Devosia sp. TaxID=1871048 RepID=UPI002635944D|nr:hypothetical protein [Devosia sp.]MDB5535377.1 hypothetical protein [Devosia sp.]MDB5585331.1 hypothetical protein [Devosia sp.]